MNSQIFTAVPAAPLVGRFLKAVSGQAGYLATHRIFNVMTKGVMT